MTSNRTALMNASAYLTSILPGMVSKRLDAERVARVGWALATSGSGQTTVSMGGNEYILNSQQPDGGWSNVEETLWALAFMKAIGEKADVESYTRGISWLTRERAPAGGWGQSRRDQPRVPLTGLVLSLLPEMRTEETCNWLKDAALGELSSPRVLSYKLSLPLIALANEPQQMGDDARKGLLNGLLPEQNADGGFAPWRGHPIGSEVWSTAFAVLALIRCRSILENKEPVYRAIRWLEQNQLEDGSWSYHYIDEGAALGCWALIEALAITK